MERLTSEQPEYVTTYRAKAREKIKYAREHPGEMIALTQGRSTLLEQGAVEEAVLIEFVGILPIDIVNAKKRAYGLPAAPPNLQEVPIAGEPVSLYIGHERTEEEEGGRGESYLTYALGPAGYRKT